MAVAFGVYPTVDFRCRYNDFTSHFGDNAFQVRPQPVPRGKPGHQEETIAAVFASFEACIPFSALC